MDSHTTPSADDKLIQLLRAYHELELRDLEGCGLPPPPDVTPVRRPTGPSRWVEAPWELRPAAKTVNWPNQSGRLRRGTDVPLDGWVQIYQIPGGPAAEDRWFLRLHFPLDENRAAPGELLGPYNNAFFDLRYSRPNGLPRLLRLRVAYDREGNLASEWHELEPGYLPLQCQVEVRLLPKSVDPAGAASRPRCPDEAAEGLDPIWVDLGGEG